MEPLQISWKRASLAGLPHWLVGILFILPNLLSAVGQTLPAVQIPSGAFLFVTDLVLIGIILLLLGLAWRTGWPRWSASLYGFGVMVGILLLAMVPQLFLKAWVSSGEDAVLFVLAPLALAGLLYAATRREAVRGLLAALPVALILWTIILEFTDPGVRALVTSVSWLAAGLAATWLTWRGEVRRGALLTIVVIVLTGLGFAVARTFYPQDIPEVQVGDFADLAERWLLPLLAITSVVFGPILLSRLRRWAGQVGQVKAFRLAVFGMVLSMTGALGAHVALQSDFFRIGYTAGPWLAALSYLGDLLFLAVILFIWKKQPAVHPPQDRFTFILSVGILLLIPAAVTLPLAFGFVTVPAALPFGLAWLRQLPTGMLYSLSVLWLLLGSWATIQDSQAEPGSYVSSPAR